MMVSRTYIHASRAGFRALTQDIKNEFQTVFLD
jgi:hypothetical protein